MASFGGVLESCVEGSVLHSLGLWKAVSALIPRPAQTPHLLQEWGAAREPPTLRLCE